MSTIRKDHIKLAEVKILDYFLQIYCISIVNTWISPVVGIHITKSKGRTSVLFHIGLSQVFFTKTYSYLLTSLSQPITCRTFVVRDI